MGEKNIKEQTLRRNEYIEELADCASTAFDTAIGPFFLGAIGIPVSLKYLGKFWVIPIEVKACASIFGAVALSIYTAKKVRIDCERKVEEKYML